MKYTPDRKGTRQLAQSAMVGGACLAAAERVTSNARMQPIPGADPSDLAEYRAAFRAQRADVTMVKTGEKRAGAIVMNDHRMERIFGGRNSVLYNALRSIDGVTF